MHELYEGLNARLAALMDPGAPLVSNLANAAALLYEELPRVNWAGFYLARGEELLLGPFGGKPACLRIPFGKGVCGTAAARRETILVPDVRAFPGHIAMKIHNGKWRRKASHGEIILHYPFYILHLNQGGTQWKLASKAKRSLP